MIKKKNIGSKAGVKFNDILYKQIVFLLHFLWKMFKNFHIINNPLYLFFDNLQLSNIPFLPQILIINSSHSEEFILFKYL